MGDFMSSGRKSIFKRKYIVNKDLQFTIILYSLILSLTVSFLDFGLNYFLSVSHQVFNTRAIVFLSFGMVVVIFILAVVGGSILTNRFAGPIFRLKSHMDEVAEGKIRMPMDFRKNDYFLELVIPYNKILTRLQEGEQKNK